MAAASALAVAPWAYSTSCFTCNVEFSLFTWPRRHHCRSCGKSFCYLHAADEMVVLAYGSTPVRVCQACRLADRLTVVMAGAAPIEAVLTPVPVAAEPIGSVKPQAPVAPAPPVKSEAPAIDVKQPVPLPPTPVTVIKAAPVPVPSAAPAVKPITPPPMQRSSPAKDSEKSDEPVPEPVSYVTEILIVPFAGTYAGWTQVDTNLNPSGTPAYVTYRTGNNVKDAIRDIRVLTDVSVTAIKGRLPRGYHLLESNLNASTSGLVTMLCWTKDYGMEPVRSIRAERTTSVFVPIKAGYEFVGGDYGGNCNYADGASMSRLRIYLTVCRKAL